MRQPGPTHVVGFPGLLHGDFLRRPLHHLALEDAQVPVDRLLPLRGQNEGNARPGRLLPAPAPPLLGVPCSPPPCSSARRASLHPCLPAPRRLPFPPLSRRPPIGAAAGAPRVRNCPQRMRSGTRTPHPDLLIYYRVVCGSGWGRDGVRAPLGGPWCGVRESRPGGHRTSWGPWVSFPRGSPARAGLLVVGEGEHVNSHFRNLLGR